MKTSTIDRGQRSADAYRGLVDPAAARSFSWVEELDNETGADILEGSVVVVLADGTIQLADTLNDPRPTGVVVDQIDDGDTGQVVFGGPVDLVLVTASVTAGQYGSTSATPGEATTSGVGNAFCMFTDSGTEPSAFLWGGRGGLGAAITIDLGDSLGAMVPYYIAVGETFTVPLYKQALYTHAITVDGVIVVDGILEFVD